MRAAQRDPSNPFLRAHLARLLLRDGQRERAVAIAETLREAGDPLSLAAARLVPIEETP